MKKIIFILIIFIVSTMATASDITALKAENRLLEAELKAGKKPEIYFVLDMKAKKVLIKSRGAVFKEMPVRGYSTWGDNPLKPLPLIKKSSFWGPSRKEIKPKKNSEEESDDDLDALEISDMPSNFTLLHSDGVLISVRAGSGAFLPVVSGTYNYLCWQVLNPVRTIWHSIAGRHYFSLDISLERRDAQGLYWALKEGMNAIIIIPED